jgi:uncharacterized protein (DUF934 family)
MPKLIKLDGEGSENQTARWAEEEFVFVPDEEPVPATGDVVVTVGRLLGEGDALLTSGRRIGVRVQPHEQVETLAYDLPQLAVVELVFAKFRDGRPYSTASVLRGRLEYRGEVRAIGDVLREQALHMVRCGFDAFVPADGSTPEEWMAAAHRYRHVYQRAADDRQPIFAERDMIASGLGHNRPDEVEA